MNENAPQGRGPDDTMHTMAQNPPPPGWYPAGDVSRWWDGERWTSHEQPLTPSATHSPAPVPAASGPLFTERSLVFHQESGLLVHHSFSILDSTGRLVGTVEGVGAGAYRRAVSHRIELRDASGELVLTIVAVVWKFGTYRIEWPGLGTAGVVKAKFFGPKFVFLSNHRQIGLIRGTSWCNFTVEDDCGRRIASIDYSRLTRDMFALPESHTTIDLEHPLPQPMASLVLASGVILNKLATSHKGV